MDTRHFSPIPHVVFYEFCSQFHSWRERYIERYIDSNREETLVCEHTQTRPHRDTHACSCTRTHIPTPTPTCTRTCAHTHTHTHVYIREQQYVVNSTQSLPSLMFPIFPPLWRSPEQSSFSSRDIICRSSSSFLNCTKNSPGVST